MRTYETLLLLSPDLADDERKGILTTLAGVIDREKGLMLTVDEWGMRDLAYPVRKLMRGYYTRLEYAADPQVIQELERIIRITDNVFKFVTVQLSDTFTAPEAA